MSPTERLKPTTPGKAPKHFWAPSSSIQGEQGSLVSSVSGGSSHGSSSTSLRHNHSFHNDIITSEPINEDSHRKHDQQVVEAGCEAIDDDLNVPDTMEVESMVSSQSSLRRGFYGEEEEEGCTIGGGGSSNSLSASSSTTNMSSAAAVPPRQPIPPARPTTPSHATPLHPSIPAEEVDGRTQPARLENKMQWENNMSRFQSLLYKFLVYTHRFISWLVFIIQKGVEPYSKPHLQTLVKVERNRSPLTNAVFCLGSEASVRHCPRLWACSQNTQVALLVLAGGGVERFLWRELKLVVYSEVNWTRALYSLRHTLWPNGTFRESSHRKYSEAEMEELKRKAANAFKKFLPSE